MDRVQRWSRGGWTTAGIRNSDFQSGYRKASRFFPGHNQYSPPSSPSHLFLSFGKFRFFVFFISPGRPSSASCSPSVTGLANR